ncbi:MULTISPECIES: sugar ABC transporter substrate-binding protein [Streptomyces]|uniref:sugar ABC transporter substrate-binding protein n=1 Tax=Streptomyces TaxID=1883 RepID=UPI0004BE1F5C|nr:sugar ABC transporter substrate-binding protein [Streptomyces griseolus]
MIPSARPLREAAVAVVITTAAAVTGCGNASGSADDPLRTFGFVNGDTSEFATCLQKAVEREAEARGVTVRTANSQMDAAKELSNVEDMLTRKVDALIVQTVNMDALKAGVGKARQAGVPLYLTSLATADTSDILGAAVVDLKKLGALDAGWIEKDANGRQVKVGIVAGSPGAASDLMVSGFTEALPGNAKTVANQSGMFNPAKAQDVAENMIQAHPDLDYVFVANEEMAFAVRKAFDAAGAGDAEIVTENGTAKGLAAVEDGRFAATVANSPGLIGKTAVASAVDLLDGKKDSAKITDVPLTLVTADNVAEAPAYCPA